MNDLLMQKVFPRQAYVISIADLPDLFEAVRGGPGVPDNPAPMRLSRTLGRTFLSLRNRNFRLYFIGQLISNTGNWLTNVALILLVPRSPAAGLPSACWRPVSSVRSSSCRRGRERSPTGPTSDACCC